PRRALLRAGAADGGLGLCGRTDHHHLPDLPAPDHRQHQDGRAEVTTRSSPAGRRHRYPPGPAVAAPAITRMGEITNPEITGQWGAGATALGLPITAPEGRMLAVFGEPSDGEAVAEGAAWAADQRPPVGPEPSAQPHRPRTGGSRLSRGARR